MTDIIKVEVNGQVYMFQGEKLRCHACNSELTPEKPMEEKKADAPPSELEEILNKLLIAVNDSFRWYGYYYLDENKFHDAKQQIIDLACKKVDEINAEFKKEGMYKFYYVLDTIKQALRGM